MRVPENKENGGTGFLRRVVFAGSPSAPFGPSSPAGRGDPMKALSGPLVNSTGHQSSASDCQHVRYEVYSYSGGSMKPRRAWER